jgi:signal transduction histidine kinase
VPLPNTGELVWRTLNGELVALRPIVNGDAVYVQAFVVSTPLLAERGSALHPSRITTQPTKNAVAPIAGTTWSVSVDAKNAINALLPALDRNRAAFRTTFAVAAAAGVLALLTIVVMLRKSEALALERARFAAAAAHELRTPLASLRLYGDMLAENLGDPSRAAHYARQISDEADRLGRVVGNVLELSRLEKGTLAIHPERGDLAMAVESCIDALRPAIHCDIQLSVERPLPQVAVDRDALFHIAQNLLDNAERYSRTSADRTIDFSVARDSAGVALSVADRGDGMTSRAPRHAQSGLGIGLAIADALSRAHGGRLAWRAREGGGTVFTVVFPA